MALDKFTQITKSGIVTTINFECHHLHSTGIVTFSSGSISAVDGTFTGDVSIGGTLTYQDVTNIDSVGIITARDGLKVLAGGANVVGVVTATSFVGGLPITNGADNRVITASSASAIQGESSLTYDALELHVNNASPKLKLTDTDNSGIVHLKNVGGVGVLTATTAMIFETGNAASPERLRITAAGNVTTTGDSTFDRADAGITPRAGDSFNVTRASGTPLELN